MNNPGRTLWLDEAMSYLFSTEKIFVYNGSIEQYTIFSDTHPPFYYLLLNFWVLLFGKSEITMRMLSLIFSFLSAIIVYLICAFYSKDKTVNFLAVLIFLLNPLVNSQANNVRMYTLLIFLLSLSYLFLIYFIKYQKNYLLFFLALFSILALYTHYFSIFTLIGLFFIEIFSFKSKRINMTCLKLLLFKDLIVTLSFIPWIFYKVLPIILYNNARWNWIPDVSVTTLSNLISSIFFNEFVFLVSAGIILIFIIISFDTKQSLTLVIDMTILSFFTFFIPFFTSTFKIILVSSILMNYYLIFLTVPFSIMLAKSFLSIISKIMFKFKIPVESKLYLNVFFILILSCLLLITPIAKSYNLNTNYPHYNELLPILESDATSKIIISPRGFNILLYYLPESNDQRLFTVPFSNITSDAFISTIQNLINKPFNIWYIRHLYYNTETENSTAVLNYLEKIGTLTYSFVDSSGLLKAWRYEVVL